MLLNPWVTPCVPRLLIVHVIVLALLLASSLSRGQQTIQSYGPEFYQSFQPVTAIDILSRIPGANAVLNKADTSGRGFNENSQLVLINGKPISAKSNSVRNVLSRIAADNVERVDLIRGGVPGLNVKSSETIIDLRLAELDGLGVSWETKLLGYEEDEYAANGGLFFNWQQGGNHWIGGLEVADRGRPEFKEAFKVSADGSPEYKRDLKLQEDGWNGKLTSTFSHAFETGSNLQFNALYEDFTNKTHKQRDQFQPSANSSLELQRYTQELNRGYKWELGADYDMPWGSDDSIKWQWIQNRTNSDFSRDIDELYPLTMATDFISNEDRKKHQGEIIGKGTLNAIHSRTFSSRSGAELVYNYLDQQLLLTADGLVTENTDQRLAEERAEVFWLGKWQLRSDLEFEAGAAIEYSEVRQSGDSRESREFVYGKPEMEVNWRPNPSENWLLGLNYDVAQLNLADFTNTIDDAQDEVRSANPDLEPEKSWQFRLQYERIFSGNIGNVTAKYYYHDLKDVVDQIPASTTESVLGNIGDGERHGLVLDADLVLAKNIRGILNMNLQRTEVTDPFTGEQRDLRDARESIITLEVRREFPRLSLPLSAGLIYYYKSSYENRRIDEINTVRESDGYLDSYFEWTLPNKVSMRVDLKNLFDNTIETDRVNYAMSIADGVVDSTERIERRLGRFWELTFSGQI